MGRILFVASVASHIKAFHLPFIRMLQDQGHDVEVACSPDIPIQGLPVVWDIPFSWSPYSPKNIKAYFSMQSLLRERSYDLIHVHTPAAAFLTRLAARELHVPVLYTAHGFHFYKGAPLKNWLVYYNMEHMASYWTAGIIVLNDEDLQSAKKFGFKEGENLFYVPGVGIDLELYRKVDNPLTKETLGLPADAKIAACIAEFTSNKNHIQLIKAWRIVKNHLPNAVLLLVGKGEYQEQVRDSVVKLDLIKNVYFAGFRTDVPNILAMADVFALTSKREGLPRGVMEAMAAGKPVVATDIRGNRDLVEDGVSGFLVQIGDVDSLAKALIKLLTNHELATNMGEVGRQKVKTYSLDNVLVKMSLIYEKYL